MNYILKVMNTSNRALNLNIAALVKITNNLHLAADSSHLSICIILSLVSTEWYGSVRYSRGPSVGVPSTVIRYLKDAARLTAQH